MYEKCELLEIRLKDEGNFLKIRETLTRIGIASKVDKKLYQTAHILHKKGIVKAVITLVEKSVRLIAGFYSAIGKYNGSGMSDGQFFLKLRHKFLIIFSYYPFFHFYLRRFKTEIKK